MNSFSPGFSHLLPKQWQAPQKKAVYKVLLLLDLKISDKGYREEKKIDLFKVFRMTTTDGFNILHKRFMARAGSSPSYSAHENALKCSQHAC